MQNNPLPRYTFLFDTYTYILYIMLNSMINTHNNIRTASWTRMTFQLINTSMLYTNRFHIHNEYKDISSILRLLTARCSHSSGKVD